MRFSERAAVECAPQPVVVGVEIDVSASNEGYNDLLRMPKGLAAVGVKARFGEDQEVFDGETQDVVAFYVRQGLPVCVEHVGVPLGSGMFVVASGLGADVAIVPEGDDWNAGCRRATELLMEGGSVECDVFPVTPMITRVVSDVVQGKAIENWASLVASDDMRARCGAVDGPTWQKVWDVVRLLLVDAFGDEKRLVESARFWGKPVQGHA